MSLIQRTDRLFSLHATWAAVSRFANSQCAMIGSRTLTNGNGDCLIKRAFASQ